MELKRVCDPTNSIEGALHFQGLSEVEKLKLTVHFLPSSPESVRNTPSTDTMPASSSQTCCADHQEPESASASYLPSTQEEETSQNLPTAHVRPSHPLKSFAVPAVPPTGSTYDPALPSTPLLSQQGEYGRMKIEWRGDR